MKDLIAAAAAVVVFLITYTPTDLAKKLEPWKFPITVALVALVAWLLVRFGIYWAGRKNARATKVSRYVLIAKTAHDALVSWHKIDAGQVDQQLLRLERSEDPVWIEDDARHARDNFLLRARDALSVRMVRENYRNEIERSNHEEFLENTRDRLVAALLKKKMPPMFNPYDDEFEPSLRQRLKRFKQRAKRKLGLT